MNTFARLRNFLPSHTVLFAAVAILALASATHAFADPIHDAARKGDMKKLNQLLQSDPQAVSAKDSNGDTPLHLAALHGELAAAQALIAAGADVNAKNNYPPFLPDDLNQLYSTSNHQDPVILLQLQGAHRTRELNTQGVTSSDLKNG